METVVQVVFGVVAALIVGAAVMVVTVRNVIHAALWLIASFFGVAALYMLLEAEFIAVVQVLVYVGAISILILFAIMLTRQVTGEGVRQLTSRWWAGLIVAAALFAAVIAPTVINHQWNIPALPPAAEGVPPQPEAIAGPAELGRGFVFEFMLQFQVAGVLLTVALIGAIVIAFEERARRRRVLTLAEEHELRRADAQRRAPESPAGEPAPQVARATDGE
ncbi:MAG TPA: NADH-quinone oxidoreductase subunit J [Chloroflexaceae bacterium]|nr:NADH-quinone oxidoreductase subunit J [Chloroflexaceae bacterium]